MKDDAHSILLERRKALYGVYQQLSAIRRTSDAQDIKDGLAKSMELLRDQIHAIVQDTAKLRHLGRGHKMSDIKGIDTQASIPSCKYSDNKLILLGCHGLRFLGRC
jgi:hypothetical protein